MLTLTGLNAWGVVPGVVAVTTGVVACVWDLRFRRIPNALTAGAVLGALVFFSATAGWTGLASCLGGTVVGLILFFPFFALRGMGAGDVKLLAALGAWLGPLLVLWVALYAAVAGAVMALVVALVRGYLGTALRNLWELLRTWTMAGIQPLPGVSLDDARGPRLAYAVPITVGAVVALWLA